MNEDDFTTLDETGLEFVALNPDGEETTYEALFTYDSDETGKSYIAYTDNEVGDDGDVAVYASTYDPSTFDSDASDGVPVDLGSIETEAEWDMIEDLLDEYNELQGAYDDVDDDQEDDEDSEDDE